MIIDCHCHVDAWETGASVRPWGGGLGNYLARAEEAGIDRTVLFSMFHHDYRAANRAVGVIVAKRPGRFFGFAFIHPERDRGRVRDMVREAVEDLGLCGLKVHRRDAVITREVCDAAREFSVPVLYDVMGEVFIIHRLAAEYPDVPFIIPHLGSFYDELPAQRGVIDALSRYRNIFADTSAVRHFDLLRAAVRRAGAEKVLFGTDGPFLHPGLESAKIRALGLGADEERLVLGGNFLRLVKSAQPAGSVVR